MVIVGIMMLTYSGLKFVDMQSFAICCAVTHTQTSSIKVLDPEISSPCAMH